MSMSKESRSWGDLTRRAFYQTDSFMNLEGALLQYVKEAGLPPHDVLDVKGILRLWCYLVWMEGRRSILFSDGFDKLGKCPVEKPKEE